MPSPLRVALHLVFKMEDNELNQEVVTSVVHDGSPSVSTLMEYASLTVKWFSYF